MAEVAGLEPAMTVGLPAFSLELYQLSYTSAKTKESLRHQTYTYFSVRGFSPWADFFYLG